MDFEKTAMDIFLPVMESAMIYAGHYCKACGRETVTTKDVEYGWKYAARVITGNKLGSFFPEIYEDDDETSSSSSSSDEDDEYEEEEFTRYTGTDELYVKMNEVYDTWSSWEPFSPAEKMIKNAIDNNQQ